MSQSRDGNLQHERVWQKGPLLVVLNLPLTPQSKRQGSTLIVWESIFTHISWELYGYSKTAVKMAVMRFLKTVKTPS